MISRNIIAPSLLAADFTRLAEEIDLINNSSADWLHLDIMDGQFVPNISFGMMVVQAVRKLCKKPLDVHLMIEDPGRYIEQFRESGADHITVHYEACPHLHRVVHQIKSTGAKAGVALNPHTPITSLEDILEDLDIALIMSVNPGFGGQQFIYQTIPRVRKLKSLITTKNTKTVIEIDGGVGLHNAEVILQAGADILVAGSSIFKAEDPIRTIEKFKQISDNLETKFA